MKKVQAVLARLLPSPHRHHLHHAQHALHALHAAAGRAGRRGGCVVPDISVRRLAVGLVLDAVRPGALPTRVAFQSPHAVLSMLDVGNFAFPVLIPAVSTGLPFS